MVWKYPSWSLLMVFDLMKIWTQVHMEAIKHLKCKNKLAAANAAMQAAKKRHKNAKQVMTAALEADDDKAQAALNILTTEFYPR
jgi:hypothetical protein